MTTFRIHGDNIVECERIAQILLGMLKPERTSASLIAPSTIAVELTAVYDGMPIQWHLLLLPGFNKNTKKRWNGDIFAGLRQAGSYFDETPDAVISEIDGEGRERILLCMEFCSALQAGNQAWQRSARAFSVGRTGCPYLYIVDFVKYELDHRTRKRKSLRFPNAAVPYSYISYAKNTGHFIAQLYTKSEEFDKAQDDALRGFDESDFGGAELGAYMVKLLLGRNTAQEEAEILRKNMNIVRFLAGKSDSRIHFTPQEWQEIRESTNQGIVDYAVNKDRFGFHKTIAEKSHHGRSKEFLRLVTRLAVGFASRDLPFGIIPADERPTFARELLRLYPDAGEKTADALRGKDGHLIVAVFKGFKPRGDDDRPDRGLLPLIDMLAGSDAQVLTYLYGPVVEANLKLLDADPKKLAQRNGLWRSILALSDYVVLDVPVLALKAYDAARVYDNRPIKAEYADMGMEHPLGLRPAFSSIPVHYGEDDVDTAIHYLFAHALSGCCFEGLCNPPGGDWSGFSVLDGCWENRWLSLPRVSDFVNGKRPDHILQLFGVFDRPVLLSIESKEKSSDLENDVGTKLVAYISKLMEFVPSAKRKILPTVEEWRWADTRTDFSRFIVISAAAYLKKKAEPSESVFRKNCEMLFVMNPRMSAETIGWEIEIIPSTERSARLKAFMMDRYRAAGDRHFLLS